MSALESGFTETAVLAGGQLEGGGKKHKSAARKNPWLKHLKAYWKLHSSMSYSEAMVKARPSYKKKSPKKKSSAKRR